MAIFRVIWEIDLDADTAQAAAEEAERVMRRPIDPADALQARCYEAYPAGMPGETVFIDLANPMED
jgi:hypothetical protein